MLEVCEIHISYFFYDKMNANQVASSSLQEEEPSSTSFHAISREGEASSQNLSPKRPNKRKISIFLAAEVDAEEEEDHSSIVEAEQDESEDFMYARTDDGTLCRFGTEGLTENEKVTFGWQKTEAENFADMRSRIGDPEVCTWISYEEYLQKKKTV